MVKLNCEGMVGHPPIKLHGEQRYCEPIGNVIVQRVYWAGNNVMKPSGCNMRDYRYHVIIFSNILIFYICFVTHKGGRLLFLIRDPHVSYYYNDQGYL